MPSLHSSPYTSPRFSGRRIEYSIIVEGDWDRSKPEGSKYPLRHYIVLALLYLSVFSGNILMSVLTSFFPKYAESKYGIGFVLVGVIFAASPFATAFVSPAAGWLAHHMSFGEHRFAVPFALLHVGLVTLFAGTLLLAFSNSFSILILSRLIEGIGFGFTSVMVMAIMIEIVDQKDLGVAMAVQETVSGIGYMVGPPLGGLLYALKGFETTIFVASAFPLFCFFSLIVLQMTVKLHPKRVVKGAAPKASMVRVNSVLITCALLVALNFFLFGFIDVSLSPHLGSWLGINAAAIGGIFAGHATIYAISAYAVGKYIPQDKMKESIVFGCFMCAASFLMLGPAPFFGAYLNAATDWTALNWSLVVFGMMLFTVGVTMTLIPLLPLMNLAIAGEGSTEYVSSMFNSAASAGAVIGPLAGGVLVEYLPKENEIGTKIHSGFPWATVVGCCILICSGIATHFLLPSGSRIEELLREKQQSEKAPLLG